MNGNVPSERKFTSSLSTGQSLEALISAPLTAISKANVMMLSGQAQFILDYCFRRNGEVYSPVLVKMAYTQDGGEQSVFSVPLLTILPMNNLAVNKVGLDFNVEVISATSRTSPQDSNSNVAKPKVIGKKSKLGVKISRSGNKSRPERQSNSIAVSIKAKQIPLTKGINILIDIYAKSITTTKE